MTEVITMALPGVIDDAKRRKLLEEAVLAYVDNDEFGEAGVTVTTYAHAALDAYELDRACSSYAAAVRARDDLDSNPGGWRDHYPDLDDDQEAAAQQLAADDVTAAMDVLLFGSSAR